MLTVDEYIRNQLLQNYFDSILLRDISARHKLRNDFILRRVSAHLYTNIGRSASSYRLSRDLGTSADTILQYFDHIEDAYLGFFLPKYALSIRKQEYNPKKFYCIDTALQKSVSFKVSDDGGKLFENAVFLALRRKYQQIYYWQEEKEVDFIIMKGDSIKHIINASVDISDEATFLREINSLKEAMYALGRETSTLVTLKGTKRLVQTDVGVVHLYPFNDFVNEFC